MQIGILTYYGVHSHGAVLQANALKSVLENMGHEVCFISFERNYDYISQSQANKYRIGIASVPFYIKYLFEKGPANILYNLRKNAILNKYRKQQFKIGPRYTEYLGDAIIVGSDEVFSLEIGINPFMYGHGLRTNRIIGYATCFGPTTMEDIYHKSMEGLISSGIKRFDYMSARDMNTKTITEKLSGNDVMLVCDPVILYGYEKEQNQNRPKEKEYILVYSYDRNMNEKAEIQHIIKYARKKKTKIISIGYPHAWCDSNINADPNELICYIKNAKAVITDTFHGTVLSIICNQKFVVKLRGNQNKLLYLLEEYDLTGRIINEFSELEKVMEKAIDFEMVNNLIEKKRKESIAYLKNALNDRS